MFTPNDIKRWLTKAGPMTAGECWLWTAGKSQQGYGLFSWQPATGPRRCTSAHRAGYIMAHGEIEAEVMVCHRCDTPACVNPAHMFLGSAKDNRADMTAKGRADYQRGHKRIFANRVRKLSDDEVRQIRADTRDAQLVAIDYAISWVTVYNIRTRRRKANVPDQADGAGEHVTPTRAASLDKRERVRNRFKRRSD